MRDGGGADLAAVADGAVQGREQPIVVQRAHFEAGIFTRIGLPVEEIASPVGAVEGDLPRPHDEADDAIAGVADPGQVAPRIRGVAGVNADGIAVNTTNRFIRSARDRTTVVTEN